MLGTISRRFRAVVDDLVSCLSQSHLWIMLGTIPGRFRAVVDLVSRLDDLYFAQNDPADGFKFAVQKSN